MQTAWPRPAVTAGDAACPSARLKEADHDSDPDDAGPAAPGFAIPDEDATDEDVDVLSLAGQRPPAEAGVLVPVAA